MFELPREIRSPPRGRFQWSMTTANIRNWHTSSGRKRTAAFHTKGDQRDGHDGRGMNFCGASAPKAGGWHHRLLRAASPLPNGCEAHDLHHDPKLIGRLRTGPRSRKRTRGPKRSPAPARGACDHQLNMSLRPGVMLRGRRRRDEPAAAGGDEGVDNIDRHALAKAEERRPGACEHMHLAPGPDPQGEPVGLAGLDKQRS